MEAQPVALILALLTRLFVGGHAAPSLNAGAIALLALGLLWWTMLVEHFMRHPSRKQYALRLHLLGWLIAFAIFVGPYLPSVVVGVQVFPALFDTAVITWFWRQHLSRVQVGFEYQQIARSFKIGLGILLAILLIVVLFPELSTLRDVLSSVLPVFFLSGLITLSLVRLGMLRSARRATDSSQADPTRSWLLALTLFGVSLLAVVILIESIFSFSAFELVITALAPLWNGIGTLVGWILYIFIVVILSPVFYLISWLFNLLKENGHSQAQNSTRGTFKPPVTTKGPVVISPDIIALGRWVFLAIALILLLIVVQATLRRFHTLNRNDGIEEVRESLDARSLLGQRWREWWDRRHGAKRTTMLEPLDPSSARARYRELLQEIALTQGELTRKPAETPNEYEVRLRHYLEQHDPLSGLNNTTPTDPTILDELTRTYAQERYGGRQTSKRQRTYLQTWVPHLLQHLTKKHRNDALHSSLPIPV
jgi:MFS family permease